MQLKRFIGLVAEFRRDLSSKDFNVDTAFYWYFNSVWRDENQDEIVNSELLRELNWARSQQEISRRHNSPTVYYWLDEYDALVVATFQRNPRKATRERFRDEIQKAIQHANHAFDATHDQLTGLCNRSGFEDAFEKSAGVLDHAIETEETSESLISRRSAIVIAFDIDHFKQVNDSFGHQYGDVVLSCFARRLEEFAVKSKKWLGEEVQIENSRQGGEEFNCLLMGDISIDLAKKYADEILAYIREETIPNPAEWENCKENLSIEEPPLGTRRIHLSGGISTLVPVAGRGERASLLIKLSSEADTALLRAKANGRDQVVVFDKILGNGGRVIEHHKDTEFVIVDIGSNVGVSVGQEFLVYHPDFTGNVPYIFDDGRTKKPLGIYPRFHYATIVAYEVQNDVSFCKYAASDNQKNFVRGSHLEAIPIGSIGHLIGDDSVDLLRTAGVELPSDQQLQQTLDGIIQAKENCIIAIFSIRNFESVRRDYGAVFINRSLHKLYETIKDMVPNEYVVGQISPFLSDRPIRDIAVIGKVEKDDSIEFQIERISSVVEDAVKRCGARVKFCVGVSHSGVVGLGEPKWEKAIEYAKYSLYLAYNTDSVVEVFSDRIVQSVLFQLRRRQQITQGLKDYKRLVEFGISTGAFHNQGALLARRANDYDAALDAIQRAIGLDEASPGYHANLGLIKFDMGDFGDAFRSFSDAEELGHGTFPFVNYLGMYAVSCYEAYERGVDSAEIERVRSLANRAMESKEEQLLVSDVQLEVLLDLISVEDH